MTAPGCSASPPPTGQGQARRILSIWFPAFAIDRWRRAVSPDRAARATALTVETAHGPRVVAVNDAAAALGVRAGARLADTRAFAPDVAAWPHDADGDATALADLALWAQRWGPGSAVDPPDGLIVDITGAAHLAGGEAALIADALARTAKSGLRARCGIAPTAGAAWAISHFAPPPTDAAAPSPAIMPADVVPADWLAAYPVAALRLDDDVRTLLRRLGMRRVGDLAAIGRDALARRFRTRRAPAANPLMRIDQLNGRSPEPILPIVAAVPAIAMRRLMEPIWTREPFDQVLGDLAVDLTGQLAARQVGARRLVLRAYRIDGSVIDHGVALSAPARDAAHFVRLFATRLDTLDAGFGIDQVTLAAPQVEVLAAAQGHLDATAQAGTPLPVCIDRMVTRLGRDAVRRPRPAASHLPERAQHWHDLLHPAPADAPPGDPPTAPRPLLLLDRPEPIAVLYATPEGLPRRFEWRGRLHDIARADGPERIAPEWWRERSTVRLRDYFRVEDADGARFWIYRNGLIDDGRGGPPDWYLHGLFA